jgi:hypothetical protein
MLGEHPARGLDMTLVSYFGHIGNARAMTGCFLVDSDDISMEIGRGVPSADTPSEVGEPVSQYHLDVLDRDCIYRV